MTIVFDFDGTISELEALEVLADIVFLNGKSEQIKDEVKRVTDLGMNGDITFRDSLIQRLSLLQPNKKDIQDLSQVLKNHISEGFEDLYRTLNEEGHKVIVISGGFKDFIDLTLDHIPVPTEDIYANHFIFRDSGEYEDFAKDNPLSESGGKVELIDTLDLKDKVVVIGDGYTDLEIKLGGKCDFFIAYTEHTRRDKVLAESDSEASNMAKVLEIINELENQ